YSLRSTHPVLNLPAPEPFLSLETFMTTAHKSPLPEQDPDLASFPRSALHFLSCGTVSVATLILALIAFLAIAAPLLGVPDPYLINPPKRLSPVSSEYWFGTDSFGRDVLARTIYGARTSLVVGIATAVAAIALGL